MILESKNIPKTPGCYLFKDEKDQIIYVGKSKFLPKRVKSYFQKNHKDKKTQSLVESINDVEFIITESESEALVVEENLIKLYKHNREASYRMTNVHKVINYTSTHVIISHQLQSQYKTLLSHLTLQ